ncbi:hypothetical protein PtB15_3B422 [Puccinia triticina]|nr:hypothetical protein PtB15_3B422 [Puccinia triticina]
MNTVYHRSAHRPSIQPREDAQPNEQGWLPPRLRRPAQPPVIRPAAAHHQQQHAYSQYHYHRQPQDHRYPTADCYRPPTHAQPPYRRHSAYENCQLPIFPSHSFNFTPDLGYARQSLKN